MVDLTLNINKLRTGKPDDKKERMNNMKKLFCISAYERQNRKRNQRKHSEDEENRRDLRGRRTGTD